MVSFGSFFFDGGVCCDPFLGGRGHCARGRGVLFIGRGYGVFFLFCCGFFCLAFCSGVFCGGCLLEIFERGGAVSPRGLSGVCLILHRGERLSARGLGGGGCVLARRGHILWGGGQTPLYTENISLSGAPPAGAKEEGGGGCVREGGGGGGRAPKRNIQEGNSGPRGGFLCERAERGEGGYAWQGEVFEIWGSFGDFLGGGGSSEGGLWVSLEGKMAAAPGRGRGGGWGGGGVCCVFGKRVVRPGFLGGWGGGGGDSAFWGGGPGGALHTRKQAEAVGDWRIYERRRTSGRAGTHSGFHGGGEGGLPRAGSDRDAMELRQWGGARK